MAKGKSASETSGAKVPVGEISPELRLPRFIFVSDHNAPGQRLTSLCHPVLDFKTQAIATADSQFADAHSEGCRWPRGIVAFVHVTEEELKSSYWSYYVHLDLLRNHDFGSDGESTHNIPVTHFPPKVFQQGSPAVATSLALARPKAQAETELRVTRPPKWRWLVKVEVIF